MAKTAERASAVLQFMGVSIVLGVVIFAVLHRLKPHRPRMAGLIAGAVVGLPLLTLSNAVARLDVPLCALTPNSWHYVLYGTAVKGTARNGAPTNSFAGNQTDRGNS